MNAKIVGTVTLNREYAFRDASYETAAWWREIRCGPQTVPITAYDVEKGRVGGSVYAGFSGAVVEDYFPSLWGGVPVSSKPYDTRQHAGQQAEARWSCYAYEFVKLLLDGGASEDGLYTVALDQSFEIRREFHFQTHWYGTQELDESFGKTSPRHFLQIRGTYDSGRYPLTEIIRDAEESARYYAERANPEQYRKETWKRLYAPEKPELDKYQAAADAYAQLLYRLYVLRDDLEGRDGAVYYEIAIPRYE